MADAPTEAPAPIAPRAADPAPTLSAPVEAANEPPALGIDALDEAAGRKEPSFDEPVRPAIAAPAAAQKAHIRLRPIETRIEARRVDTLRADPPMTARRPIFPHIEPEEWPDEWNVPPVVAARASRERRGTGWAIGLGSLLLIAGITAPAAIWQGAPAVQDQVALVTPRAGHAKTNHARRTRRARRQPKAPTPAWRCRQRRSQRPHSPAAPSAPRRRTRRRRQPQAQTPGAVRAAAN